MNFTFFYTIERTIERFETSSMLSVENRFLFPPGLKKNFTTCFHPVPLIN